MPHTSKPALHIASFDGNIGDNASHNGFYRQLKQTTTVQPEMEQREIRKTYLNYRGNDRWSWDESLIEDINSRPLSVIGGGNYFELWLENSRSGTTIDLAPDLLHMVQKPLFFHALGCDPNLGVSDRTVDRFRHFIETALESPWCLTSVRNDGSLKYLRQYLGDDIARRIVVTPDPGFFVDTTGGELPVPLRDKRYWAMNLACDRPERRFPGGDGKLNYDGFVNEIARLITLSCETYNDLEIVLTAHIYSDLDPIRDVLKALPDHIRRWKVSVAPLLHGMGAERSLFALYEQAELALGPRFHANVCPIGLGTPTIGLVTTEKLTDLYEELGMPERTVSAQHAGFCDQVMALAEQSIQSIEALKQQYRDVRRRLEEQSAHVYGRVQELVDQS